MLRLRQIALAVHDLEPSVEALRKLFGWEVAHRDPGVEIFGLANAVLPAGDRFIEVLSPRREGTTVGRLLERRGGDCGYMIILQSDERAANRRRVEAEGARVVWEADLGDAATFHLHPKDTGGALLSFDWMRDPESWFWAGTEWRRSVRTQRVTSLLGAEIRAAEAELVAQRWSRLIGKPLRETGNGWRLSLDAGRLDFVLDPNFIDATLRSIMLEVSDPEALVQRASSLGLVDPKGRMIIAGIEWRGQSR